MSRRRVPGALALLAGTAVLTTASATLTPPTVLPTALAAVGTRASAGDAPTAAAGWLNRTTRWVTSRQRTTTPRSPRGATPGAAGKAAAGRVGAAAVPVTVPADLRSYLQDDRTDLQWSLRATHLDQAWAASRGAGVVVATIDTGADAANPDLAGRLVPGGYLTPAGTVAAGTRPDALGHGTHVAGIIAGTDDGHGMTGVAPQAKIMPIDVDTNDSMLTGRQVAAGIDWAATHGAHVINVSLGFADVATTTTDVRAVCQAVTAAVARKVVVVAASGNDGDDANHAKAPANCPGAISVAALDSDLHPAPWSSFDGTVTIAAPGSAIYSAVSPAASPLRYAAESGTSMSAPFVSGVVALLLAQHPDWTPAQVTARLTSTARDIAPAGRDPRTGAGVVDPVAALGLDGPAPEPVPALGVLADPYASHTDRQGSPVFDRMELHWVPDPTFPVTGYRVTRWAASGTTTTSYGPDVVRAVFPAGQAGYQVTATTQDGEVPSAPIWFPLAGQDYTPLAPVTGLRANWTASGGLTIRWANPARNRGIADQFAVLVNGDLALTRENVTIPTSVTVPASHVPAGDLVISVLIGSSRSLDVESTKAGLRARVPFSGTGVAAGKGRYRVDLALAPSRRSLCGRSGCTGLPVTVTAGGYRHGSRLDSAGHVVVLVSARPVRGRITVAVSVSGHPTLSDRAVAVTVG